MNDRRSLIIILLIVTLDVAALGTMIAVLPTIMKGFTGGDEASAAEMLGLFAILWATMQFLFSPLIGALSDKYGRRPVIMVSCLGLAIDYVFVAPSIEVRDCRVTFDTPSANEPGLFPSDHVGLVADLELS